MIYMTARKKSGGRKSCYDRPSPEYAGLEELLHGLEHRGVVVGDNLAALRREGLGAQVGDDFGALEGFQALLDTDALHRNTVLGQMAGQALNVGGPLPIH